MKRIFSIITVLLLTASILKATETDLVKDEKVKFKINEKVGDNELKFESKAPLEDFMGTVESSQIKSTVTFNTKNIEKTSAMVKFPVKSMTTGISRRDGHMYGEDWLHAEKYPNIIFNLNSLNDIEFSENSNLKITLDATAKGEITVRGVTKSVTAPVNIVFLKESKLTKARAAGHLLLVKGEFKLNLKEFNIQGKQDLIGNKVAENVNIIMNLYYNTGA